MFFSYDSEDKGGRMVFVIYEVPDAQVPEVWGRYLNNADGPYESDVADRAILVTWLYPGGEVQQFVGDAVRFGGGLQIDG